MSIKRELSFRHWIDSNADQENSEEETSESSFIAYIILAMSMYLNNLFLPPQT